GSLDGIHSFFVGCCVHLCFNKYVFCQLNTGFEVAGGLWMIHMRLFREVCCCKGRGVSVRNVSSPCHDPEGVLRPKLSKCCQHVCRRALFSLENTAPTRS